ncbi:citrate synthase [Chthonomonas calidirosea]|uniref:citrate/2-methylcitrate synthase n=1 Tax=Chthonomonas calidirosea TaxID=454171 RepID=UPI0006DD4ADC|nr:citrate/2-methylcitrate synthase [Chthonomonas calidirosea]CEK19661.1 citrate synthase [Chthonomonas calidirosea]CEK19670.1 citrate synthase [Chthonomonas calidirosea]
MTAVAEGLRDVVIGTSTICEVLPSGQLFYRGYNIHDLADHSSFEEVIYLLWHGRLPTLAQLERFKAQLQQEMAFAENVFPLLKLFPKSAPPMDALRTAVSALGMFDADNGIHTPEANLRKSIRLQAAMPVLVAAFERLRQGLEPIKPRPELGIAGNFLYMLRGEEADPLYTRTLDIDFILHADHEINASTFATRVTVATGADIYAGIVSGIGTLSGPKHGAAAEETMRMLLEIGDISQVDAYIRPRLTGEKRIPIPGFGHAVYRAPDPRAQHLREMSRKLGELHNNLKWFEMTTAIEKLVEELSNTPERLAAGKQPIYANVDCFSASCYYVMGFPVHLYTPLFAISRTAGWCAHMMEQIQHQKLIRPRAEYVGPHNLPYIPIAQRENGIH